MFFRHSQTRQYYKNTRRQQKIDNIPSNTICYCIGRTCYYCPAGLYCNNDHSGCCPKPHCNNHCGKYCVCPGYLCCENQGACRKEYPTCCKDEKLCCKSNAGCCGKGCCEKQNRCCEDDNEAHYCIESKKDNYLYFLESISTKKETSRVESVNINYFKNMCTLFAEGTRKQNPSKRPKIVQFAAMTLNQASKDDISLNKFDPFPIVFELDEQKHNYVSAPPLKPEKGKAIHAETRILEEQTMKDMLKWFGEYRHKSLPQPPSVYLLTYLSPCPECLQVIANLRNNLKIGEIFVAWHLTYDGMSQTDFLAGLENFYQKGIKVIYNLVDGLCSDAGSKRIIPLFQPAFHEFMMKVYSGKSLGNCNANEISSTFAKLINWLVWKCQGSFKTDKSDTAWENVANCLKDSINKLDPKVDPCMNLQNQVQDFILIYRRSASNEKLLLSPPLNPTDPSTISNDVTDLRGSYNQFCIQVNFEKL